MRILLLIFCLQPAVSRALTLAITDRAFPGGNAAYDLLADSLENQFNSQISPGWDQAGFLGAVGDANAMSSRGFIAPGATAGTSKFYVSAAASGAVALGEGTRFTTALSPRQNELPKIGLSAKAGISFGISGSTLPKFLPLDPARTLVSASYFSSDQLPFQASRLRISSSQVSVGLSYQFDVPKALGSFFRFNGFKFTTGLSYSVFEAGYELPFQLNAAAGANSLTWSDDVSVKLQSKVFSASNEIVTGVRAFWIANLYTGVGVDLNVGSTSLTTSSSGPIQAVDPGGVTQFTGIATLSGSRQSRAPSPFQIRYLAGTQLDLGPVGIYIQAQMATSSVYGLNLGAHFAL